MPSERKIRAYVEIPVSPTDLGHTILHALTITNISLSGCFVLTRQQVEIGSPISIGLPLAGGGIWELEGRVVRKQSDPHGVGISFEGISGEEKRELALLIADSIEKRDL